LSTDLLSDSEIQARSAVEKVFSTSIPTLAQVFSMEEMANITTDTRHAVLILTSFRGVKLKTASIMIK
jgi:hypothetical protein